jgi:hypothetical protein
MLLLDVNSDTSARVDGSRNAPWQLFKEMVTHKDNNGMLLLHHIVAQSKRLSLNELIFLIESYPEILAVSDNHNSFSLCMFEQRFAHCALHVSVKLYPNSLLHTKRKID